MKYTIEELEHLRNVRLKGFDKNEMKDDWYCNAHDSFSVETDRFLKWLKKMEGNRKIEHLLSTMPNGGAIDYISDVELFGEKIDDDNGMGMHGIKTGTFNGHRVQVIATMSQYQIVFDNGVSIMQEDLTGITFD